MVALLLVLVGCVMTLPADDSTLTAEIASATARAMVQMRATPAPTPKPDSGKCSTCWAANPPGGGWLGDGTVKVPCPECNKKKAAK
jgi:hypothetical protein